MLCRVEGLSGLMDDNKVRLAERGEKLRTLQDKMETMASDAQDATARPARSGGSCDGCSAACRRLRGNGRAMDGLHGSAQGLCGWVANRLHLNMPLARCYLAVIIFTAPILVCLSI